MSILVLTWLAPVSLAAMLLAAATATRLIFLTSRTYAEAALGLLIASLPFTLITPFTLTTKIVVILLQLMMMLLAGRLLFGRLDKAFVIPSTRANLAIVFGLLLLICAGWWLGDSFPGLLGDYQWRWFVLLAGVGGLQLLFLRQLLWSFQHYRIVPSDAKRPMKELPTVSVCIPARNEDHALEDCISAVLASTYPKLEVLVLDDCSQDKTSQIIRSFAHDGVRFVQGQTPANGWLGKNQAMQTLAEQATGDFLLFVDVDTLLGPESITQLVNCALDEHVDMITVLPQNRLGLQPGVLLNNLRYFWQMVLPITKRRISVADQVWLIRAKTLLSLGSFASVAHKIVPEATFARHLFNSNHYRFVAGNSSLGITTAKKWRSQLESALRVLYPTYHRQPVIALAAIICIALVELAPFGLAVWLALHQQFDGLFWLAMLVIILTYSVFALTIQRSHGRVWLITTLLLPVLAAQEIILIIASVLNYEFGEVNWKGRNVCYPVISSGQTRSALHALDERRHVSAGS